MTTTNSNNDGNAIYESMMNGTYNQQNPYGPGRDALSCDDDVTEEAPKAPPQPAPDHNVRINPYAGQGSVTSSTQEQTGKPVFFNNAGQIFDTSKVDEHTPVKIGAVETSTGVALRQGYIEKNAQGDYVLTSLGRAYQGKAQQAAAPQHTESTLSSQNQATIAKMRSRIQFGEGTNLDGLIGAAADFMLDGKNVEFGRCCNEIAEATRTDPASIAPWIDDMANESLEKALSIGGKATGLAGDYLWQKMNSNAGRSTRAQFVKAALSGDTRTIVQICNALRFGDTLR